jgi:hypothetical protein
MKLSSLLVTLASALHLLAYLYAAPEHVVDDAWPLHARFHVLQAIFWIIGFDLAAIAIARGPLRRREPWAWWALASAFVPLHGAYFIAMVAIPGGQPPELSSHAILGAIAAVYAAGVALGVGAVTARRPRPSASET